MNGKRWGRLASAVYASRRLTGLFALANGVMAVGFFWGAIKGWDDMPLALAIPFYAASFVVLVVSLSSVALVEGRGE